MKVSTRSIARAAVIAGAYAGLCVLLAPVSYGVLQVRVAEGLTVLPILWPDAVVGLTLGALIANLAGPFGIIDAIFGTAATALAAYLTYWRRRSRAPYIYPIIANGLIVGAYLPIVTHMEIHWWTFPATMLAVAAGEAVAVLAFGLPLLHALRKIGLGK
ncbi:MAG: QueT transporter family protein [Clostridia bacterium]|nr:QueT transporter family protein [Clostridia bacterium]